MRGRLLAAVLLLASAIQPAAEPIVRIGLTQNAPAVTVRSASPFTVAQRSTRSAAFSNVVALDAVPAGGALKKSELQYRVTVELDDETVVVLPPGAHARIEPGSALLEIDDRAYHG